jgi:uncharacterized membrane protein
MGGIGRYAKAVVAVLSAVTTALTVQYPSTDHWIPIVTAALGAVAVYLVPNQGTTP